VPRQTAFLLPTMLAALLAAGCHRSNPDKLWEIVHQQCVPEQREHGTPAHCAQVELGEGEARGYAVLKDIKGPYQYLLIPTAKLSGIESPELLAADAPRYFSAAWAARKYVEQGYGKPLPREALSLAVNSKFGRSQNQLHIHVDCLRAEVRQALQAQLPKIGPAWKRLEIPLMGHYYRAMRIAEAPFLQGNAFDLIGQSGAEEMGRHTLVAAGATFEDGSPGFILLDDRAELSTMDLAHGEDLQSHSCS
jgi:CDP-diacylglycerol pyrophosphatase